MVCDYDAATAKSQTLQFASGEILALSQKQIQSIPYLCALVSTEKFFKSSCNEHGHYELDPLIEFKNFLFIIESISFHSIRELFTHLPEENDVLSTIDLLDLSNILCHLDPSLNDVDTVFFSTMLYSPMLEGHFQTIRPSDLQDMAVRLAIGMIRKTYDLTKTDVIDQVYWFITFTLSAHELLGLRLRYHIYKIAEYCFSRCQPSLLKPLNEIMHRIEINQSKKN